jgi:sulfatase modifying factor 1
MVLIDGKHCPEVQRTCLDDEHTKANKLVICHKFVEEPPKCIAESRRQRYCIDRYEFPNKEGARAPVMVDFYDAMHLCGEQGKRLCWESEWTAACEGPEYRPFPYGYSRDVTACNIDQPWINPDLKKFYSKYPIIADPELTRLDQGVPSGSREKCVSGYGIRDQPGNVDEWVMLETKRGKGGWAGLKGGAWGHVRNACRPVTTSHEALFSYYNVSFRCCRDAKPAAGGEAQWKPPPIPANEKPATAMYRGWTPTKPSRATPSADLLKAVEFEKSHAPPR